MMASGTSSLWSRETRSLTHSLTLHFCPANPDHSFTIHNDRRFVLNLPLFHKTHQHFSFSEEILIDFVYSYAATLALAAQKPSDIE